MSHCKVHKLETIYSDEDENYSDSGMELEEFDIPTALTNKLKSKGITPELGDLIEDESESGYRNDGIYIWDGLKVIELECEPDDYGTLPQMFRVIEPTISADGSVRTFPLRYWHDVFGEGWRDITHNGIVWFDYRPRKDELLRNLHYDNQLFPGKWALYTSFIYNEKTYYIIYNYRNNICNDDMYCYSCYEDGSSGSHPPKIQAQLKQLLASGLSEDDALRIVGCEPHRINKDTYELLMPEIFAKIQQKFLNLLSGDKLIPFDCYPQDSYEIAPNQDQILFF